MPEKHIVKPRVGTYKDGEHGTLFDVFQLYCNPLTVSLLNPTSKLFIERSILQPSQALPYFLYPNTGWGKEGEKGGGRTTNAFKSSRHFS